MTKVSIIIDYGDMYDDRYEKREWKFEDVDDAEDLFDELCEYVYLPDHEIKDDD
jgi:hypothetical protein